MPWQLTVRSKASRGVVFCILYFVFFVYCFQQGSPYLLNRSVQGLCFRPCCTGDRNPPAPPINNWKEVAWELCHHLHQCQAEDAKHGKLIRSVRPLMTTDLVPRCSCEIKWFVNGKWSCPPQVAYFGQVYLSIYQLPDRHSWSPSCAGVPFVPLPRSSMVWTQGKTESDPVMSKQRLQIVV